MPCPRMGAVTYGLLAMMFAGVALEVAAQPAIDPACEKLLPAALVGKVSGEQDVQSIGRDPSKGAGGTCNYAVGGKTMMLLVMIDRWKNVDRYLQYAGGAKAKKAVGGVGDEAFFTSDTILFVRRGDQMVQFSVFARIDPKTARMGKAYFTREQLTALAKQMSGKP